jgi:hypothetical protein
MLRFQSLIAPRYPRRYIGRHRARFAFWLLGAGTPRVPQ